MGLGATGDRQKAGKQTRGGDMGCGGVAVGTDVPGANANAGMGTFGPGSPFRQTTHETLLVENRTDLAVQGQTLLWAL